MGDGVSSRRMAKILVTDTINLGSYDFPDMQVDYREGIKREELMSVVGGYDAIITRSRTQVDAELIQAAKNVKVIGRGGVGVDNIDIDAASRKGILVLNAPESNNVSAAELAIALMMAAARGIGRSDKQIRNGTWDRKFLGRELKGATLGIVGLGRIGSLVTKRVQGMGMKVIAYDPYISKNRAEDLKVELYDNLKQMLVKCDFLTVHTPLTEETLGMIGRDELACLPRHAVVVNAARGGIIDENADHPLLALDNVVLTAHLGANTEEAQARVGAEILERVVMALRGDISRGAVNAPSMAPGVMEALGKYLELGEHLGKMAAQLSKGRPRELQVEFSGTFPSDPEPIAIAVTKGFLEPILNEPPNYINAPSIAKERDIRITKSAASRSRGYTNHVMVSVTTDEGKGETTSIGGTVLGNHPRIVSINGFTIEIRPEHTMLLCTNYDRPGAVGKVGTVLGNAGVNISSLQLSRVGEDGLAMFALTVDQTPSDETLNMLRDMKDVIRTLQVVKL
jgi:D-3-phosphoglycerate dehydrogenase / 2-oxoglutarate reductase